MLGSLSLVPLVRGRSCSIKDGCSGGVGRAFPIQFIATEECQPTKNLAVIAGKDPSTIETPTEHCIRRSGKSNSS